jgi:ribosomal protein S18 acetylase RimI-like enzyme
MSLVALDEKTDEIVGYMLVHYAKDIPDLHSELQISDMNEKDHKCIFIHDVSVDPFYRGRGIAKNIVNHFMESDVASGEIICLVSVNDSCGFWEKMGFRTVNHEKQFHFYGDYCVMIARN